MPRFLILGNGDPLVFHCRASLKAAVESEAFEWLEEIITADVGEPCQNITEDVAREIWAAKVADGDGNCSAGLADFLAHHVGIFTVNTRELTGEEIDYEATRSDLEYDRRVGR